MRTVRPERWLLALALACCALDAAATELGTLFYTPEERARMDRARRGEIQVEGSEAAPGARAVTGYVKRSDGRGTAWIDGKPVQVTTPRARALLEPGAVRGYGRDDNVRIERVAPR